MAGLGSVIVAVHILIVITLRLTLSAASEDVNSDAWELVFRNIPWNLSGLIHRYADFIHPLDQSLESGRHQLWWFNCAHPHPLYHLHAWALVFRYASLSIEKHSNHILLITSWAELGTPSISGCTLNNNLSGSFPEVLTKKSDYRVSRLTESHVWKRELSYGTDIYCNRLCERK